MTCIRIIWICLFAFFSFSNVCAGNEISASSEEMTEERLYVSPDQIILTEKGIFLMTDKGMRLIDRLECDENGIYIPSLVAWTKEKCPLGHEVTCRRCHGCNWRNCKHACWCR